MIDRYRQRDARKSEKEASRQTKEKEEEKIQFNLKIASAKVTKSKSEVSGDTSIQTKLHDGKFMMAISDGMGSRTKS